MKAISIGRDNECNIVLNDKTDVVSRRHAVLNITSTGKMTIIDQSHNGTYVNGIRVTSNTPFPVTRKDVVSFAHIIQLDWNLVPNTAAKMRNTIIGIIALVIILCGPTAFFLNNRDNHKDIKANVVNTLKKDSIKQDSTKRDTIKSKKAITKNNKEIKTGEKKKRKSNKKVVDNKEKETRPKKEKEVNNRTIG